MLPCALTLALACLLTVCGGGSGQSLDDTATIREAIGGTPLALSRAEICNALVAIECRADSVDINDSEAICSDTGCRPARPTIRFPAGVQHL